jgi:hypothetical protein
VFGLNLTF